MLRDRSALRAIPFDYSRPLPSPPTNHRGRADRHYDVIAPPLGTYAGNLESDSTPKELFVMHTAGQDGMGSSSYIDSFVLRDADLNASGGFGGASDGTLEDRKYCLQNWRADVVALARTDGYLAEQIRYSAYGTPTSFHPVDIADDAGNPLPSTGVNNGVDSGDYNLFWAVYFLDPPDNAPADVGDEYGGSLPSWGLNNGVNEGDYNFFGAAFFDYRSFGRGVLSDGPTANNRLGYAGYEYDPILTGGYYHVRHRVYDSGNGRWTRRDPLGYVDGMGLYEYCRSMPEVFADGFGTACLTTIDPLCAVRGCVGSPAMVRECIREILTILGLSAEAIAQYLAQLVGGGITYMAAAAAAAPPLVKVTAVAVALTLPETVDMIRAERFLSEYARQVGWCRGIYSAYKAACKLQVTCDPGLPCEAYEIILRLKENCIRLRSLYVATGCDNIIPTGVDHPAHIIQELRSLANCYSYRAIACLGR